MQQPIEKNINPYLTILKQLQIIPNFWTSEEYLLKSNTVWIEEKGLFGFKVETDSEEWLLPPLDEKGYPVLSVPIYAGWPDENPENPFYPKFLDYQFIYNPKEFQNLSGGKWQTFRKNIRKYPQRIHKPLLYITIHQEGYLTALSHILLEWQSNREVFDPETFTRFVLSGDNRKGLFVDGRLVGLNVWDENYQYINFRYCIDDGSPFLNEYIRYLFYTDKEIIQCNKMVNDGGSLGSENLLKFKQKLNPCQIMKIYSYK